MSKYEGNYPRLVEQLRDDNAALRAENARLQIQCDQAYLSGMKHGWNCCASNDATRYSNAIDNTREQIRAARAAIGETE